MTVISYKHLNVDDIQLSVPFKKDGVYLSSVQLKGEGSIQTPELIFNGNTIQFPMVKRGQFFSFLEELEERIISLIYTNSKTFFNGKTFSEKRIRSSYQKTFELNNEGIVTLKNITSINAKVYDSFKESVSVPPIPFNAICILHIGPVKFSKKDIVLSYQITHFKLPFIKKKKR